MKPVVIILALAFCLIFILLLFVGCKSNQSTNGDKTGSAASSGASASSGEDGKKPVYRKLSAKDAHEMMAESTGFILVDVRTESEYTERRIVGAVLIPVDQLSGRAGTELSDKDQLIFVYCRSGGRSASAANTLVGLGYTNVYDIGGIQNWPYETTQ